MCNIYGSLDEEQLELFLGLDDQMGWDQPTWVDPVMAPRKIGAFVIAGPHSPRIILGQWGMIRPGSPERIMRKAPRANQKKCDILATNNARRETMKTAPTYRGAWARGQRCLIPAAWFDEPYWGISHADPLTPAPKSAWWRFWRSDGQPWMLAGLWDEWKDPLTGEIVPNYTMITQNCDHHPLLSLMHRPDVDPKTRQPLPVERQDKRTVVSLERADWSTWLTGSEAEAEALIRVPPVELFRHHAADPSIELALPVAPE